MPNQRFQRDSSQNGENSNKGEQCVIVNERSRRGVEAPPGEFTRKFLERRMQEHKAWQDWWLLDIGEDR